MCLRALYVRGDSSQSARQMWPPARLRRGPRLVTLRPFILLSFHPRVVVLAERARSRKKQQQQQ